MPEAEYRLELLQLALATQMDGRALVSIYDRFGSIAAIESVTEQQWSDINASPAQIQALRHACAPEAAARRDAALRWAEPADRAILYLESPAYSPLLAAIPDPPLFLFVQGSDHSLLNAMQVAVVGARKASAVARHFTEQLCRKIAAAGLVLTSGMAYGVDACVHQAAVHEDKPTIAVHGCGLDYCYPAAHAGLRAAIAANGLHVSEFAPWVRPRKHHFPRRNRIISGLSSLLVVIEAGSRSGSLSTARHALSQGREVLVAPGPAAAEQCLGSNRLLRDGAGVVLEFGDVLAALPQYDAVMPKSKEHESQQCSADARLLLELLSPSLQETDLIIARSSLGTARALAALTELELGGQLIREGSMLAKA